MASPARKAISLEPSRSVALFSEPHKRNVVLCLGLLLITVLTYFPVTKNAFINFDDNQYIIANPQVTAGLSWETVKWAFTTFDAANWHPLTWLSHSIDYQLFGMNPAGHHFISVLFHALNALLLFLLLQTVTGCTWRSVFVALLFAVHPLNVESVAWAAERKTLLSTSFFLLATWAYVSYVRVPGRKRYFSVALLFAFALMSKPQVITFPCVLLLLDFWPLRRTRLSRPSRNSAAREPAASFTQLLVEKIPLFALSAVSAIVTVAAQRSGDALRTVEEYSLVSRLENAVTSYLIYLKDIFYPRHLAPLYPHPTAFNTWHVAWAALTSAAISLCAIALRKSAPYFLFGWLWFLGTLVPMIGLVQVGLQARADRYAYIPMIGILVTCIWGAAESSTRLKTTRQWGIAASAAAVPALAVLSFHQVTLWRSSEVLWNYTMSVTNDNFMAEDNLAQELAHQGRTQEALAHFHHILYMHDWRPSDLIAFGLYEQRNGYDSDAIREYERAFQNAIDAQTRAVALSNIGSAYLDLKKSDKAELNFEKALQLDPDNVPALIGTAVIGEKNGKFEFAIRQCTRALSIRPSDLGYELLGRAYEQNGNATQATAAYRQAQRLSANYSETRSLVTHLLSR
jgi:tetratricopeptide (TPR) repeat protein